MLTLRTFLNQRDLRKSLAQVFSRVVRIGVAERCPHGVETRRLNEQVRRNRRRFPADFVFRLTREELDNLMSQFATSNWGGRRKLPYAFTQHGAIQAATIYRRPLGDENRVESQITTRAVVFATLAKYPRLE